MSSTDSLNSFTPTNPVADEEWTRDRRELTPKRKIQDILCVKDSTSVRAGWKFTLAVSGAFVAIMIVASILAAKGILPSHIAPSVSGFNTLCTFTGILGGLEVAAIITTLVAYYRRKKELEPERPKKIKVAPIVPINWIVSGVFAAAILGVIITVSVLATKGSIHLPHAVTTGFKVVGGAMGTSYLLCIPLLIGYYVHAKKQRENYKLNRHIDEEAAHDEPPQEQVEQPTNNTHSEPVAVIPEREVASEREWRGLLTNAPRHGLLDDEGTPRPVCYNLSDPDQPIPASQHSPEFLQLPILGSYQKGFDATSQLMAVRLPRSQAKTFPYRDELIKEQNLECYFIVFDNRTRGKGKEPMNNERNIAMHMMAFPDYDTQNPTNQELNIKVRMSNPSEGVKSKTSKYAIPLNHTRFQKISIHPSPQEDEGLMLSPNNMQILIDPNVPVSSCYLDMWFGGKAVAVHAVFLNDDKTPEGQKLLTAIEQRNLQGFLDTLNDDNDRDETINQIQTTFLYHGTFR